MNPPAIMEATTPTANAQQSLGKLAVSIPGATAIFRKLKLDFCCGGQQSLENACTEKGLDASQVLAQIRALDHTESLPPTPSAPELIDHILQRFH